MGIRKGIYLSIMLMVVGLMSLLTGIASSEKNEVRFLSAEENKGMEEFEEKIQFIIDCIASDESKDDTPFGVTELIPTINDSNTMYAFVSNPNSEDYVIRVVDDKEGNQSISYYKRPDFCFSDLKPGDYGIFHTNDGDFIVGNNGFVLGISNIEVTTVPIDFASFDEGVFRRILIKPVKPSGGAKSLITRSLNVAYVPNGGVYGVCWTAASASICRYLGFASVSRNYIHTIAHAMEAHSLMDCPGGSLTSSKYAIESITSKAGTRSTSRCNAANTLTSINNNIPIYADMRYYVNGIATLGHAVVICGYKFNNSTGAFTYEIMNPNSTVREYVVSSYSASSVYFPFVLTSAETNAPGTYSFKWYEGIFDWH